ncbi:tRNA 2-selenouridine synthase [Hydrogenivirga caldilitoris]|uniref:tRNA 2-selenouridine synthase n=1 Tax=Hydrogenivirga caldilitoris TaxID=246264 RepID=A0A497XP78_9AQUI|nr:tRNA 2-selenouridine(34) synthase MnmH [Hydrogenivirga caldilitoris]RLJ70668.1 tRNA 2-selenouridine synthase [Hydrogenivirga caldilitoris]
MAYKDIEVHELFQLEDMVIVDIRSPQEFEEFHIPGAINVPLFENDEKKLIGFIYREEGLERAKELGQELARKKLEEFYARFRGLKDKHKNVVVYCWRGGMRSQGMCKAMSEMGIDLLRLKGGYRAYRQFILKDMERLLENVNFLVITGKTGVGKTKVIRALKQEGLPAIDLEDLAKDRGSVFGSVGIEERVSQKQFDSLLYEELRRINGNNVFIEDESRRIGNVYIPEAFWSKKDKGLYIELTASIDTRIRNIISDYTQKENWEEEAFTAVQKIRKYLGPQKFELVKELFEQKNYEEVVRFLIEEYYDKRYRQFGEPLLEVSCDNLKDCVEQLKEFYSQVESGILKRDEVAKP